MSERTSMIEFVESSRGYKTFRIDGRTIKFRGKTPLPEVDGPDWIVYTKCICDVDQQEYVIDKNAKCYLSKLKDYAFQKEMALAFDSVRTPNDFSEKIYRFFDWGGPRKEVTNFDMGLGILFCIALLAIGLMMSWLFD